MSLRPKSGMANGKRQMAKGKWTWFSPAAIFHLPFAVMFVVFVAWSSVYRF